MASLGYRLRKYRDLVRRVVTHEGSGSWIDPVHP